MTCPRGCCATYREHIASISISSAATPTRSGALQTRRIQSEDTKLAKDAEAMKHLKKEGIVPRSSVGVHEIVVKAETRQEIESGRIFSKEERSIVADSGLV